MELLENKLGMGDVESLQAAVDHLISEEVCYSIRKIA